MGIEGLQRKYSIQFKNVTESKLVNTKLWPEARDRFFLGFTDMPLSSTSIPFRVVIHPSLCTSLRRRCLALLLGH
jgi:hypothetical protein